MKSLSWTHFMQVGFLFLFASEFTFYLLILQTGIVEYHHSDLLQVWMVPTGGILGIIASIFLYQKRRWLIPPLLLLQLFLSLHYASANGIELFLMGLISGLTAPMLIARIDRLWLAVLALALSYTYGTYYFSVPAVERTSIAFFLSAVAFGASLFSQIDLKKQSTRFISLYGAGAIFLWLLLDAALFESLSRNEIMHIWGEHSYTLNIIAFHVLGLIAAYKAREYKHNDAVMVALFFLAYSAYASGWQWMLSLIYPFVISYYNVIILKELMKLPYALLAVMALSLWGASGMGLLIALKGSFYVAWALWFILLLTYIAKYIVVNNHKLRKTLSLWIVTPKS
ncbi:hypothetical protein PGH07_05320 [Sulfurovum sp. zt1-1]|uniref:Uncharacterized protein n=1 Tax=Sulfurovum zhangzhouensis TaxID=3019067 RepID=A0ABT7QXP2_9BACT|nr:hypothetical protein [Sulfurovum zhangzhouensis]MDM5271587.1 hypothetical protein [Sulfurovum zhangzhouensis]